MDHANEEKLVSSNDAAEAMAEVGRQLGHPLRVLLLEYVAEAGPCPFSELVDAVGAAPAQVSNHLTVLRRAGLLATQREGRQSLYRLPNAHIAEVLANLAGAVGATRKVPAAAVRPLSASARRCYDHIGGRLGVALLRTLLDRRALVGDPAENGALSAGPAAELMLPKFGISHWPALSQKRRRFAYGCPDWTERAPHLGGALGAALSTSLQKRMWVRSEAGSRALTATDAGRAALADLGVSW